MLAAAIKKDSPQPTLSGLGATGVAVHFDGVRAVDGVSLELAQGEIIGLIGPNGAGKSTFVNAISGFQSLTAGSVMLDGKDVSGWPPHRLAQAGLVRTFQGSRLFAELTVEENIQAAVVTRRMSWPEVRRKAREAIELADLSDVANRLAGELPFGYERRLGVARAIACQPRYLLLDEPAAGLNEEEGAALVDLIRKVRDICKCGVLLIDHDMRVVMAVCERIVVVDFGKVVMTGTPDEVTSNPKVREAYLGSQA